MFPKDELRNIYISVTVVCFAFGVALKVLGKTVQNVEYREGQTFLYGPFYGAGA